MGLLAAETIGYLIPEFPGQTHIWMWREIVHLRQWGLPIRIFSTRRPPARDRARHAFAASAASETVYLWPLGIGRSLGGLIWAAATRPIGLARCVGLALALPVEGRPRWRRVLPLIVPACAMARAARRLGVTRLHSHSCSQSAILCMMVKRLLGIPYSMTLNANIEWWGGAMREKFEDADFTIAITQRLLDQIGRDFPRSVADRCLLGRIGVDTRKWVPPEPPEPPRPRAIRLLSVGRLHRSKGHDVLIEAVRRLLDGGTEATLQIIGDGPERPALEAQAAAAGLAGRIAFLGSLAEDQVIAHLRDAEVFVLASVAEPLGVVYMEAMAMRVAVIGTAAGGVGEIITPGVDGLLVPPSDPVRLAQAIRLLAEDPDYRARIAATGRRTVVERFDSRIGAATLFARLTGRAPSEATPAAP
jgi:glycosyltransferase involved in cell wall biosynthesis